MNMRKIMSNDDYQFHQFNFDEKSEKDNCYKMNEILEEDSLT